VPPHSLTDLAGLRVSAEDFLAAASETAARPIWVVDPDDVIRFANHAAITALGYDSADELLGRHRHETIHYKHPDGTPYRAAECPMQLPRTKEQTVARDLDWFFRRDGSKFPVSYMSVPIEMSEGRGAVVAFADIEGRSRAEQVLHERDAVQGAREDSLRRIAALVAGGAASADVFAAIAREVGQVVGLPLVVVLRYDAEQTTATVTGAWSEVPHPFQTGTSWPLDGPTMLVQILKTGRPTRIDDYTELPGTIADAGRKSGFCAAAAAPIIVDGDVWGAMTATAGGARLPDHMEDRLAEFTELVATAILNTESRAGLARLAEEQAALRRVATLVARGTPQEELFAAVIQEVGRLLPVEYALMERYEPDEMVAVVGAWGEKGPIYVGARGPLGGKNIVTSVFETACSVRMDHFADASGPLGVVAHSMGVRSAVGTPIIVEGHLWGVVVAGSRREQPLAADTEARLASFTELLATAISNAESRAGLARLAEEQAALRRVATLTVQGTSPEELFAAVVEEVGRVFPVENVGLARYESGGTMTTVAISEGLADSFPVGGRWPLGGKNVSTVVLETGRSARLDHYADASGRLGVAMRERGLASSVGAPIIVEGRVWGVMTLASTEDALPADTEARLASFTELVATAIANTEARTEVAASRARIVAAADEERRRVVRDLHDGAQQRLVQTVLTLKLARRALQNEEEDLPALLTEALDNAERGTAELRELAHGILPAVLTRGGLRAGVDALASRVPVPVENAVSVGRLPAAVEATAYFVVAEALTNVTKHSRAGRASVAARVEDGTFRVRVRDDGVGGALPDGSGLLGLTDRLAVLNGQLRVESPIDGGTLVAADIPVPDQLPTPAGDGAAASRKK
jgi:PAS domain S-box-containing protein